MKDTLDKALVEYRQRSDKEVLDDQAQNYGRRITQAPRLQVRVSPTVKEAIKGIFVGRKGQARIVAIAESLGLLETLRLLSLEEKVLNSNCNIIVTPTPTLLDRAAQFYLSPHMLVRAAAVKLATQVKEEQLAQGGGSISE